jgi:hypothetical protein
MTGDVSSPDNDSSLDNFINRFGNGQGFEDYRDDIMEGGSQELDPATFDPRDINPEAHYLSPDEDVPLVDPAVDKFLKHLENGGRNDDYVDHESLETNQDSPPTTFRINDIARYDESQAPTQLIRRHRIDAGMDRPVKDRSPLEHAFGDKVAEAASECIQRVVDGENFDARTILSVLNRVHMQIIEDDFLADAISKGLFRLPDIHDLFEVFESQLLELRSALEDGPEVPRIYISILRGNIKLMETTGNAIIEFSH